MGAAELNLPSCSLDLTSPPDYGITSGDTGTFRVFIADQYDNRITTQPTNYWVNYTVIGAPTNEPACTDCNTCVWASDRFECSFTRFIASSQTIDPRVYNLGTLVGSVPNANFTVTIAVGADAAESIPTGDFGTPTIVGRSRSFFVQARDAYNVSRSTPNTAGTFSASFTPPVCMFCLVLEYFKIDLYAFFCLRIL